MFYINTKKTPSIMYNITITITQSIFLLVKNDFKYTSCHNEVMINTIIDNILNHCMVVDTVTLDSLRDLYTQEKGKEWRKMKEVRIIDTVPLLHVFFIKM